MPIFDPIDTNNLDRIRAVIESQPDSIHPRVRGDWSPLHYAVKANSPEIVVLLLGHGADVNVTMNYPTGSGHGWLSWKERDTPLHIATRNNSKTIADLLIKKGAHPDMPGWADLEDEYDVD